jgi:hypothetical protein
MCKAVPAARLECRSRPMATSVPDKWSSKTEFGLSVQTNDQNRPKGGSFHAVTDNFLLKISAILTGSVYSSALTDSSWMSLALGTQPELTRLAQSGSGLATWVLPHVSP